MTILQDAKPSLVAAAKAERERDKTEAMREYQSRKSRFSGQHGAASRSAPREGEGKYRFAAASGTASGEAESSK